MDTEVLEVPAGPGDTTLGGNGADDAHDGPARLLERLDALDLESSNGEAWDDLEELYGVLPGFEVGDVAAANLGLMETHARARNYLTRLIQEREAHARQMLEDAKRRVEAYRQRAIGPVERAQTWHEECLGRLLTLSGQRRLDLVHGRVEHTAQREDLQKEDDRFDGQIVAWLRQQGRDCAIRRRVEEAPDMRQLKKLWKEQGLVPPHTRVVTVGGHLKITAPEELEGSPSQVVTKEPAVP